MPTFLYRQGDGNEGNYPREIVTLKPSDSPYAAVAALVANRYIPGGAVRRHIVREVQTDGEAAHGVYATVYEGPNGEQAFGAAWITAELEPLSEEDAEHYASRGMYAHPLREVLDSAALAQFRKLNRK